MADIARISDVICFVQVQWRRHLAADFCWASYWSVGINQEIYTFQLKRLGWILVGIGPATGLPNFARLSNLPA
jgi:hypothetical protein